MNLKQLASKYLGRVILVEERYNTGSWDNYAMDPYIYWATILDEDNNIKCIQVDSETKIDATPQVIAVYDAIIKARSDAKYLEEKIAREKIIAETESKRKLVQSKVVVLRGKNRNFEGIVKWFGTTQYGEALLIINETGKKIYTKPSNVKQVA